MQNHKSNSFIKFLVTAVLAFMLLLGFALPTSVILSNVQRYEEMTVKAASNSIEVQGLKREYTIGSEVTIPASNGATIVVKDPKNNSVTLDANNKFIANLAGDYTVEYKNGSATTGEIIISISASQPKFNFDVADKKLLPSEIATNTQVTFPNPQILDEKGEVISGTVATLTIKKSGSSTPITTTTVTEDGKSYQQYTFAEKGVYSVVYSYKGTGFNYIDQKYTIEVSEGYQDDVDLTYTLNGTMPTSLVQGVEVELPTVTGKDKNNNNAVVDVITKIDVEHLNAEGNFVAVPVDGYKFTPAQAGTYRIKYTVEDFYGNSYQEVYDPIENVRDSKAPTIKVVNDYIIEQDGSVSQTTIDGLVDASANIPSIVAIGQSVTLPAIFADDNVASFKDLSLKRLIKNGTDQIANLDDKSVEGQENNKINESVSYIFEDAGTYTIIYKASDNTNSTTDSLYSYTIKVVEALNDEIAPTIIVKEFVKNENGAKIDIAKPGDTIRIVKPSVIDYVNPEDPSNIDTYDIRPTLEVSAQIEGDVTTLETLTLNEEGNYYEYVIPEDASGRVVVTYKAKDCNGNIGNGDADEGLIKYLDIVNTNETSLPTISNIPTIGTIKQYETIDLATGKLLKDVLDADTRVQVEDTIDSDVQFKIVIKMGDEVIERDLDMTTMLTKDGSGSVRIVKNASFTANRSGNYTVSYIAYDHAGNYTVATSEFSVTSIQVPVLVVNDYSTEMELGNAFIPQAKLYLEGKLQEGAEISTIVEGNINAIGTVKVTYKATASNGIEAEDVTITIAVKDSTNPVIVLDGEVPEYVDLVQDSNDSSLYEEVVLPGFTATDSGSKVDRSKYKIVVKNSNGVEIVSENSANGVSFRPTGDGKYKAEYSATDFAGNVTTKTFTINVGDIERPTLTINKAPETKASLKNGSYTLSIDTSSDNIVITDNKSDSALSNDTYLSVVVANASGTAIDADEDTDNVYTLTEAGEYTITITASDKAGNTRTEVYKLDLSAESNSASTTTEVLGTILLVVAILVLIGVVWYFVKPAPKSKKDKKKSTKLDDKF